MNEEHYLIKGLKDTEVFSFYSSAFFFLNELNKKITLNELTKEQIIELIREDLFKVKTKLNVIMLHEMDKKKE